MADVKKKLKKLLGKVEDPELKQELKEMIENEAHSEDQAKEVEPTITAPEDDTPPPAVIVLPEEALGQFRELQKRSINVEHVAGTHYLNFHKNMQPVREELDRLIGLFEEVKTGLVKEFAPLGEEGSYVVGLPSDGSDGLVLIKKETE